MSSRCFNPAMKSICDVPETKKGFFSTTTISASGAKSLNVFAQYSPENPPPRITIRVFPEDGMADICFPFIICSSPDATFERMPLIKMPPARLIPTPLRRLRRFIFCIVHLLSLKCVHTEIPHEPINAAETRQDLLEASKKVKEETKAIRNKAPLPL